ncbi:hypothetical protein [Paenibacillus thermotolerans]|uniref:hypothetical protein n=1 Tax=Paenibacillus thermotolerans TaxID=3027807 RepID=UPI002368D3CE|nr:MULTISPECIES: hypothetical protein [unclassified Paenibacillus]
MKLRLLPIMITVVVSSVLMFGGWFVYQTMALQDPLTHDVGAVEGVKHVQIDMDRSSAVVKIELENGVSLDKTYAAVEEAAHNVLGDKPVTIEVANGGSEALDSIWEQAMFDVATAMETKQYTLIPKRLNELVQANDGLHASTKMDDKYVYVTLTQGADTKYVVLPRIPVTLGVFPNE